MNPNISTWLRNRSVQLNNLLIALLACNILVALPAYAQDYDLVILNGRVIDPETMLDAVLNVGITDGKIAVITSDSIKGGTPSTRRATSWRRASSTLMPTIY